MSPITILPPQAEPVHIDAGKAQCRVIDDTAEDAWFADTIPKARAFVETYTRRALVRRIVEITLDQFPECGVILLPVTPLRKVVEVRYLDTNGFDQVLPLSELRISTRAEPPEIAPAYGKVWQSTLPTEAAITLQVEVGHVAPFTVDAALDKLLAAGHGCTEGGPVYFTNSGGALPAPLVATGHYYAKNVDAAGFQVAASAGGAAINITGAGTGTHFIGEIPQDILQALLMVLDHRYANRGAVSLDAQPYDMPLGVDALLFPHRVARF